MRPISWPKAPILEVFRNFWDTRTLPRPKSTPTLRISACVIFTKSFIAGVWPMSSFLKIRDIFFSGAHAFAGNADAIGEITFLVDEGYLTIDQVVVADKSGYIRLLDDEAFYKESMGKISGGGLSHIILKKLSGHYLMEHRGLAVYYEHPFVGYYPDVISKNKLVVVTNERMLVINCQT